MSYAPYHSAKILFYFCATNFFSERFFISRNAKNRCLIATFRCHRKRAELDLVDILQKQANFS